MARRRNDAKGERQVQTRIPLRHCVKFPKPKPPRDDSYKARFRRKDPDGRLWSDYDISAKGLSGGGCEYEYKGIRSLWRVPLDTMKRLDADGRLHFTKSGGVRRKRCLDEMKGRPAQALWDDVNAINSQARERVGYPTQKPIALYERIIRASSRPGDMVLDPFCGCATTPIAAERLGRRWVGIDIWEGAYQMILRRLRSEGLATPEGAYCDDEQPNLLTEGDVRLATRPPERTDDGDAAPTLRLTLRVCLTIRLMSPAALASGKSSPDESTPPKSPPASRSLCSSCDACPAKPASAASNLLCQHALATRRRTNTRLDARRRMAKSERLALS